LHLSAKVRKSSGSRFLSLQDTSVFGGFVQIVERQNGHGGQADTHGNGPTEGNAWRI